MTTKTETEGGLPFLAYEIVEATFVAPDQDLRIPHTLVCDDPNDIVYLVLAQSGDGVIYDSRARSGGTAWIRSAIVLRSNRAPSTVTLLLAVRKRR